MVAVNNILLIYPGFDVRYMDHNESGGYSHAFSLINFASNKFKNVYIFCNKLSDDYILTENLSPLEWPSNIYIHPIYSYRKFNTFNNIFKDSTNNIIKLSISNFLKLLRNFFYILLSFYVILKNKIKYKIVYERSVEHFMCGLFISFFSNSKLISEVNDLVYSFISVYLSDVVVSPSTNFLKNRSGYLLQLPWGVNKITPKELIPDNEFFIIDKIHSSNLIVLTSSYMPWHCTLELVNIAKKCPELTFLMVGNGIMKDLVTQRIAELKLNNVISINFLSRQGLHYLYSKKCVLGLAIYSKELSGIRAEMATPIKVLEYMQSGLPILITKNANHSNIVTDNGFIIDNFDELEVINALNNFFYNLSLERIKAMRLSSTARAELFTWDNHYFHIFDSLNK